MHKRRTFLGATIAGVMVLGACAPCGPSYRAQADGDCEPNYTRGITLCTIPLLPGDDSICTWYPDGATLPQGRDDLLMCTVTEPGVMPELACTEGRISYGEFCRRNRLPCRSFGPAETFGI